MSTTDLKQPSSSKTYDELRDGYKKMVQDRRHFREVWKDYELKMLGHLQRTFPEATMEDVRRIGTADIRVWHDQGIRCERCRDPIRWCEHFGTRWEIVRMSVDEYGAPCEPRLTVTLDNCPAYFEARKREAATRDVSDTGVGFKRRK